MPGFFLSMLSHPHPCCDEQNVVNSSTDDISQFFASPPVPPNPSAAALPAQKGQVYFFPLTGLLLVIPPGLCENEQKQIIAQVASSDIMIEAVC